MSSKQIQLAMLNLLCGFCGNPSAHGLRKHVRKFSLFFIPLFPIAPAKHSLQCTFCGAESEITKENAEQLLAQGGGQGPQPGMGAPQQQGGGNPFAGQQAQPPQQPQQQGGGNPFAGQPQQGQQGQNPYQS
ncbi:zinc-ribbon domain-containing protein [Streptomyces armeniacus]|uniref:Zinc-ribbon domain-containing protein n=2 Tax=Streptomyces armeniacus TaxID=83291 RepID=A0A345Y055_9ACTN|nr:zinc-ribbon domain-containing protein [Streptomyces armeniacus]AXK37271.1 zinc-ribbon domain-containing protein [Streptomyces armeniacus]